VKCSSILIAFLFFVLLPEAVGGEELIQLQTPEGVCLGEVRSFATNKTEEGEHGIAFFIEIPCNKEEYNVQSITSKVFPGDRGTCIKFFWEDHSQILVLQDETQYIVFAVPVLNRCVQF